MKSLMFSKPRTARSKKYLDFIRKQACLMCGKKSDSALGGFLSHPHHVSYNDNRIGGKPSDISAIPLCWKCHRELHDHGMPYAWKEAVAVHILWYLNEYLAERSW